MSTIIDFHTHILPGIDDGSKDVEMTSEMLAMSVEQGVKYIVTTPHFYADRMTIDRFLMRRENAYRKIAEIAKQNNVGLIPGAEVCFFPSISNADHLEELCIGSIKSSLIMIEMPFRAWHEHDLEEIERLIHRGFRPVIAHLDRFYQFQTDKTMIPALLEMPVIIQINCEALLQRKNRRQILKLFEGSEMPILGTDCHNLTDRVPNMMKARKILESKVGNNVLERMDRFGVSVFRS